MILAWLRQAPSCRQLAYQQQRRNAIPVPGRTHMRSYEMGLW